MRCLAANGGRMTVAELAEEIVETEQAAERRDERTSASPPVEFFVGVGGVVAVVGANAGTPPFDAFSVETWAAAAFGLLVASGLYRLATDGR